MEFDLKHFKPTTWAFVILLFISVACPGFLIIFSFKPDLFLQLEFLKLALLGLSITLPIWFLNLSIVRLLMDLNEDFDYEVIGMQASVFSIFTIYTPLIINFLNDISVSNAFYIGIAVELIVILTGIIHRYLK